MPSIQLSSSGQFQSVAHKVALDRMLTCATLKACSLSEKEERKPIDLTVVLDRSGSMGGEKLDLCLATIEFLTEQLGAKDRLGLVTFDTNVRTDWSLIKMDKPGKAYVNDAVKNIRAGSTTNLSGGLMAGVEELKKGAPGDSNEVKSLMLLTDGLANHGITDSAAIVKMLQSALDSPGMEQASVFTFGYGADHNQDMLRAISDAGRGVYYFVDEIDDVPTAFADCLGGLLSVVGQNIKLRIGVPAPAANSAEAQPTITKIHTKRPVTEVVKGQLYEVSVGDMFAEEERDVLVEMSLPSLETPIPAGSTAEVVLQCNARYVDVIEGVMQGRELPNSPTPAVVLPIPTATPAGTTDEGEAAGANDAGAGVSTEDIADSMVLVGSVDPSLSIDQTAAMHARAEGTESVVSVRRPVDTPDEAEGGSAATSGVSVHITRQWARIVSADAMDAARKVADKGHYTQGQKVLDDALQEVRKAQGQVKKAKKAKGDATGSKVAGATDAESEKTVFGFGFGSSSSSPSKAGAGAGAGADAGADGTANADADDALLSNLIDQLQECHTDMKQSALSRHHWESKAKYQMCNYAQGHHTQRSNCSKMTAGSKSAYRSKTKQAMCASSAVSASVIRSKSARSSGSGGSSSSSAGPPAPSSRSLMNSMSRNRKQKKRASASKSPPLPAQLYAQQQQQQQQLASPAAPPPPEPCQQQARRGSGGIMNTIFESVRGSFNSSSNSLALSQQRSPRPSA
jgi:Mg-chelatase subunit ChlD